MEEEQEFGGTLIEDKSWLLCHSPRPKAATGRVLFVCSAGTDVIEQSTARVFIPCSHDFCRATTR